MNKNEENVEELPVKKEEKETSEETKSTQEVESDDANIEITAGEYKDLKNFQEKFYYLAAEHENFKKRSEREKQNLLKFGQEGILKDLVEVMDNFDRTIGAIESENDEKIKNIKEGVEMVQKLFFNSLKKAGLESIETIGKVFDPNIHEALSQQEVEGKKENEIVQEFQKGYMLNGRLLRAAKVVVAK